MISTPGASLTATMLSAVSADETFSRPIDVRGYTHIAVYVIANGTVSSGAVTVNEACLDPATDLPYSGTWVAVGSAVTPATGTVVVAHLTVAAYSHVQARVNTAIGGGGTVTVVLVAA